MAEQIGEAKIGSKEEAAWTAIKERAEKEAEEMARAVEINKEVAKFAREKIEKLK